MTPTSDRNSEFEQDGCERPSSPIRKVIYDFGANNGDDIPYYLKKADLVVAVEANPSLCEQMRERFAAEISAGRLSIENSVLTGAMAQPNVFFYLHKRHHVLGQFPKPNEAVIHDYTRVSLPAKPVMQIIREHGAPYYIKIDIEGYEEIILNELFTNDIRPPYISAESLSIRVFATLVASGGYTAFKLVEGATVEKKFRNHKILVNGEFEAYSFPSHSAGPFGEDIPSQWLNADDLFSELAAKGLGWRDIHATHLVNPDRVSRREERRFAIRHFRGWLSSRFHSSREHPRQ